jgi:ornithine carbamoyltransferase
MLKTKNYNAEFAFEQAMRLAGGASEYGDSTKASIGAECHNNETIKMLAGMYLVGSSERAERNLARLDDKLRQVFGI